MPTLDLLSFEVGSECSRTARYNSHRYSIVFVLVSFKDV